MPYTCEFVKSPGCFVATFTGSIDRDSFLAFFAELSRHPEFRAGLHRFCDFRGAEVGLSLDELQYVSGRIQSVDVSHGTRKVVFLVRRDMDFGVMRQFTAMADQLRASISGFRDTEEAKASVGLPSDYVLPADR